MSHVLCYTEINGTQRNSAERKIESVSILPPESQWSRRVQEIESELPVASLWGDGGSSISMCVPEIHTFRRQTFSETVPGPVPLGSLEDITVQRPIKYSTRPQQHPVLPNIEVSHC